MAGLRVGTAPSFTAGKDLDPQGHTVATSVRLLTQTPSLVSKWLRGKNMLSVGRFTFLPPRRPRSGVWERPSSLHWWNPQVRGCCLTCTDTRGREGSPGAPGDLASQPLTQGARRSAHDAAHTSSPAGMDGPLPVMTQRPHVHVDSGGVWAGRALKGEQQRDLPSSGLREGVSVHVGAACDGASRAPGKPRTAAALPAARSLPGARTPPSKHLPGLPTSSETSGKPHSFTCPF